MRNSGFLRGLSDQPAWAVTAASWLLAVGAAGLAWYLVRLRLRNRPRTCPACRADMLRLGEAAADPQLTGGQNARHPHQSGGYDVWTCPRCPHVAKIRHGTFVTSAAACPTCRQTTQCRTIARFRSPSTWSSGLEEICEHCPRCDSAEMSTRVIPRRSDDDASFWPAPPRR